MPTQDEYERQRGGSANCAESTTSLHQRRGHFPVYADNIYNSRIMYGKGRDLDRWGEKWGESERTDCYSDRRYPLDDGLGQRYRNDSIPAVESFYDDCNHVESQAYFYRDSFQRSYLNEVNSLASEIKKGPEKLIKDSQRGLYGANEPSRNYFSPYHYGRPCSAYTTPDFVCSPTTSNVANYSTSQFMQVKPAPASFTSSTVDSVTSDSSGYHTTSKFAEHTSSQFPTKMKSTPDSPSITIEVATGIFAQLRGAEETTMAIKNDFFMPCECPCCSETIFCIQDADFVLCPNCRIIFPMGERTDTKNCFGGVGLGFCMEELARIQRHILDNL